ncbi:hypothetical protein GGS23DRAFT_605116 [Durotheca rogersii]|uniref:uncharacterized protein n=1 Tax=Durotheca rogersii TaxID=419775 RepID=UPI00221FBEE2|nr:uncharacterized protein GGS23DRAFT_605116 [Durotheca rogersii]KAI5862992.1 hypothetical protein GGS23DRAFT_605116 [Durotheca rogersii]
MGAAKDGNGPSSANPFAPYQQPHRTTTTRTSQSHGSYEVGEASTTSTFLDAASASSMALATSSALMDAGESSPSRYAPDQGTRDLNHEMQKRRRSYKTRSSGGFLLANTMLDEAPKTSPTSRDDGRRRSRIPVDSRKGKSPLNMADGTDARAFSPTGLGIDSPSVRRSSDGQPRRLSPVPDDERRHSPSGRASRIPTLRPSTAPLDADSTQIVNMALNLSESRRLAARRNVSSPMPPRLAQIPDTLGGTGLKQHLHQQRRTSRTVSPNPDRALTPRPLSSPRVASPLKGAFDHDGTYTYHFSSSTLNRAQKAKEYLELMAQYRRLLQFVPPLRQDMRSRPSSSNHSMSPTAPKPPLNPLTGSPHVPLGRPYNPLQYIRNRKVRARERKAIDGEAQGFSDISKVTDWIDETTRSSTTSTLLSGVPTLPSFPGAHENPEQDLPPSNIPRPISIVGKPKRLRVDWSIDPADMLADTYWLEQGDNKYLIEDRDYSKIFPRKPEANEPAGPAVPVLSPRGSEVGDAAIAVETDILSPTRVETESSLTSARERARQKLQDLRGIHHRQHSHAHGHHHDLLRFRKGSLSDTSDSESDRKRRNRTDTITANGTDLLVKQINDMLAKEASEEQKENLVEADGGYLKQLPSRMATPEKSTQASEMMHSRRGSRAEDQEKVNRGRASPILSPLGSGRASLEVPGQNFRFSMDLDSSRPVSPDPKSPRVQNGQVSTVGMDHSPPQSRPGSPSRKPFSRVKKIFRDRSRERAADHVPIEKDIKVETPAGTPEPLSLSSLAVTRLQSPDQRRSKSLTRKVAPKSNEAPKGHRTIASVNLRGDELGLRRIFKGGAKIDGVIRGGVSKVTDLIWKKDSDGDTDSSSSGDSDAEGRRGRSKVAAALSRDSSKRRRHLEAPSPSKTTAGSQDTTTSQETELPVLHSPTSRPSRSPRFERLKPPRIDIRKASPSDFDRAKIRLSGEFDVSDTERRDRDSDTQAERPQDPLQDTGDVGPIPPSSRALQTRPRHASMALSHRDRQWSVSNQSPSSHGAQISRHEAARLRALVLCTGIKAMEISRRAHEPRPLFALDSSDVGLPWADFSLFAAADGRFNVSVPQTELFPTSSQLLSDIIERSIATSEATVTRFSLETGPSLQRRVELLQDRVGGDLADMTRRAADEADEVSRDLMDSQRLQVKRVADTMDKMLRRRRRRFRWARRAGWLAVEWVLVGFMWYVWFVVTVARVFLGVGKGIVSAVKWLLWL